MQVPKQKSQHAFHLAGIIPVAGQPLDFNFDWSDCLMPLAPNYTAVERSVIECAYAGCETIWLVCNNDIAPLVRLQVGDYIQADSHLGTVLDIQIFSTVLKTPDNKLVIVPNGSIMNGSIVNFSHQAERRVDIIASCSYDDDIDKVKSVLTDILSKDERILSEPKPRIALSELADSSVNFIVRPWVKNADYLDVYYSLLEEIKKRFDQEGISIPYPQSDVHIHNHSE